MMSSADIGSQQLFNLDQAQFLDVLNALPDATLVVESAGIIVFASVKTEAIYGYKPDELIGLKIESLIPDSFQGIHVKLREAYFNKPSIRLPGNGLELQGKRKNGEIFPAEVTLSHIQSTQGFLAICSIRDISDRKITERLLINDERFQLLMQNAPAAIAMFDQDMRYLVVSRRWLEDYRLFKQDIIGRRHCEVFPDVPEHWKEVYLRCLAGETIRCEDDFFTDTDGVINWVRWEMCPWYNNENTIGGTVLFTEDVTWRKQAQLELEKSLERFQKVFENSIIGIVMTEQQSGRFLLANNTYCQLLGYSLDELKSLTFRDLVHPDDVQENANKVKSLLENNLPSVEIINRYIRKNGDTVWVRKFIQTFPAKAGEEPSLMAIVLNHSALKAAEDSLKASHDQLEQMIRERTLELEIAVEIAERADKIKSNFLTAASHDLRQPLQSATLLLSVLCRLGIDPKQQEICDNLQQSLDAMTFLLNGLLDISRFQGGMIKPNLQDFNLDILLSRIVANNIQPAKAKGLKLIYDVNHCVIHSDSALLERIIENYIANAISYTQQGVVAITCAHSGSDVCISVSDTGIGIPPDELENIFDEYYQLSNPGRDRRKGLGLGLAIVKLIAKILGHKIGVQSQLGKGSVFSVTVPLGQNQQNRPTTRNALQIEKNVQDKLGILFIDDEPEIIEAMKMLFDANGFNSYLAESGEAALNQIRSGIHPDIIISDYRLPGYNGIETINKIRELLAVNVPAIILSGDTSLNHFEDSSLSDSRVFLKPVDTVKLISAVVTMINAHQSSQRKKVSIARFKLLI